jgi:hypothetical protein
VLKAGIVTGIMIGALFAGYLVWPQKVENTLDSCLSAPIWVTRDLKWEDPPKEAELKIQFAQGASLLMFARNGNFVRMSSSLIKQADGKSFAIARGDGFADYRGAWSIVGQELRIKLRLVDARIPAVGASLPGPERLEVGTVANVCKGELKLQGTEYREIQGLLEQDRQSLIYRTADK